MGNFSCQLPGHNIRFVHQHGRRFIVWKLTNNEYGRYNVTWKRSTLINDCLERYILPTY